MAFTDLKYTRDPGETGPHMQVKLAVCFVMLLLPLLLRGTESVLLIFVPGLVACMLSGLFLINVIYFSSVVFVVGSAAAFMQGRPEAALWMVQAAGMTVLLITRMKQPGGGSDFFLQGAVFLCFTVVAAFVMGNGFNLAEGYKIAADNITRELDSSLKLYLDGVGNSTVPPDLALWFQQMVELITRFFPGLVMVNMVMAAFLNTVVLRRCLVKNYGRHVPIPEFTEWRMPEWLVWPWIAAGVCCFASTPLYSLAGKNLLFVLSSLYFVAGISVVQFLFKRFQVPRWIRWTTWLLLGLQWYGAILIAAMGLADVWIDFRQKFAMPDRSDEGNGDVQ